MNRTFVTSTAITIANGINNSVTARNIVCEAVIITASTVSTATVTVFMASKEVTL